MDHKAFTDAALGELVRIDAPSSKWAFSPAPLPDTWDIPHKIWPLLLEAREAIAELNGVGRHIPAYRLLLRPLQSREALRSSSMEGTYATPEQLLLYQAEPREPQEPNDQLNASREVSNYDQALVVGQGLLDDGHPLSVGLIRTLHDVLLSGVRGDDKSPGEFRRTQVQVGADARYMPPPPHLLSDCLDSLENSLYSKNSIDPLIWAFMVHYQFETIHPFNDGTGRVGRLLLSLQIYRALQLSAPWLYLSPFFDKYKDEYIDNLFRVSTHGDWERWIAFCLRASAYQAKDAMKRFNALVDLRERYNARIIESATDVKFRIYTILDRLFERPIITIPQASKITEVTYPTAQSDLKFLERLGILNQGPEEVRPRFYIASEVLRIAFLDID